ncbi:unnamed protein product [Caenorhabditis auriculariae]|uniref:Uncharacterized protein n=1 Tax=Caenorhabditis auriculariae TaxID=2777116 RepID=A0A8S1H2J5_9PELO|nr:unnamed protein product [Caenorhabditis auriculariae]
MGGVDQENAELDQNSSDKIDVKAADSDDFLFKKPTLPAFRILSSEKANIEQKPPSKPSESSSFWNPFDAGVTDTLPEKFEAPENSKLMMKRKNKMAKKDSATPEASEHPFKKPLFPLIKKRSVVNSKNSLRKFNFDEPSSRFDFKRMRTVEKSIGLSDMSYYPNFSSGEEPAMVHGNNPGNEEKELYEESSRPFEEKTAKNYLLGGLKAEESEPDFQKAMNPHFRSDCDSKAPFKPLEIRMSWCTFDLKKIAILENGPNSSGMSCHEKFLSGKTRNAQHNDAREEDEDSYGGKNIE